MDIGFFVGKFLEANPDAVLDEASRIDLTNQTDKSRWKRSLQYNSQLLNVKYPYIMYITRAQGASSSATSGRGVHMQVVHPVALKKGMALNDLRKALMGDIEVWCNCPDFNYGGFYYILSRKRPNTAALAPEEVKQLSGTSDFSPSRVRFSPPRIRNPQMTGALCKHLYSVLDVIQTHAGHIHKRLPQVTQEPETKKKPDEKEQDKKPTTGTGSDQGEDTSK